MSQGWGSGAFGGAGIPCNAVSGIGDQAMDAQHRIQSSESPTRGFPEGFRTAQPRSEQ